MVPHHERDEGVSSDLDRLATLWNHRDVQVRAVALLGPHVRTHGHAPEEQRPPGDVERPLQPGRRQRDHRHVDPADERHRLHRNAFVHRWAGGLDARVRQVFGQANDAMRCGRPKEHAHAGCHDHAHREPCRATGRTGPIAAVVRRLSVRRGTTPGGHPTRVCQQDVEEQQHGTHGPPRLHPGGPRRQYLVLPIWQRGASRRGLEQQVSPLLDPVDEEAAFRMRVAAAGQQVKHATVVARRVCQRDAVAHPT